VGAANLADAQTSATALGELTAYMHQLIDRKRGNPGEDVISDLAAASDLWGSRSRSPALNSSFMLPVRTR
jgi:hypothetical protein